jgi:hypothetical protein
MMPERKIIMEFDYTRLTPEKIRRIKDLANVLDNEKDTSVWQGLVWAILSSCTDAHIPIHPTFLEPAAKEFIEGYAIYKILNK